MVLSQVKLIKRRKFYFENVSLPKPISFTSSVAGVFRICLNIGFGVEPRGYLAF